MNIEQDRPDSGPRGSLPADDEELLDATIWMPQPGCMLRVGDRLTDRAGQAQVVIGLKRRVLGMTYMLADIDDDVLGPTMEMFAVDVDDGIDDGGWTVEFADHPSSGEN